MQSYFYSLMDRLCAELPAHQVLLAYVKGEASDFVQLNHGKIRQALHVQMMQVAFTLIDGARHGRVEIMLQGPSGATLADDLTRCRAHLERLRAQLHELPEDPHLSFATTVQNTSHVSANRLPKTADVIDLMVTTSEAGAGSDHKGPLDVVGVYAAGMICHGFANSLGQRNWFTTHTFNVDWSTYVGEDKAVKSMYSGTDFSAPELRARMISAAQRSTVLRAPNRAMKPGRYDVFLTPAALQQVVHMLTWGGFGLRDHRTKQTPLIQMREEGLRLHPLVHLSQDLRSGLAPAFDDTGHVRPDYVSLIAEGAYHDCLVSARSAREFGVPNNGAGDDEMPVAISMNAGDLPTRDALRELGTGIYISDLWYLNFSDRNRCCLTGMTRFATLWVEGGECVAPLGVMRFDESVYRMLGSHLQALTQEREFMLDPHSYGHRSTASSHLPGALIRDFTLTL